MSSQEEWEATLARFRPVFDRFAERHGLRSAHDFSDGAQLYLEWRSKAGYRCYITLLGVVLPDPLQLGVHCFPPSFGETRWVERHAAMDLTRDSPAEACWWILDEYRRWAEGLRERRNPDGSLDLQPLLDALRGAHAGERGGAAYSLAKSGRREFVPAIVAAA